MPYLNLKVAGPAGAETLARLAANLTRVTGEVLRKDQSVTAIAIDRVPIETWHVGGRAIAADETAFFLHVTVTAGTNTPDEKAGFLRAAYAAAAAALPNVNPASYIVVHEERADAWGYAGVTQETRHAAKQSAPRKPGVSARNLTATTG
jgi:4-oxalocrotonate tautomerase